jgi:hypothetical protein
MADWYYTTNRQQMGPVSLMELRQLANQGLLKPTDLVWCDGMRGWLRASSQQALFTPSHGATDAAPGLAARVVEIEGDAPERSSPGREEDEGDGGSRRGRARSDSDAMPVGLKVGLIVAGMVLVLLVAGSGLYWLLRPGSVNPLAGLGTVPGTLGGHEMRDPQTGGPSRIYNVRLVQGKTYVIDLRSQQFDAFLRLEDSASRELAQDNNSGGGVNGLDARIVFFCPRTDNYRIIATSFPGGSGPYTLSIRQN